MKGKTCLITGATSGIGRATALALARQGARLLVVARDGARGEKTVAELKAVTGNHEVELVLADLSSQQSIRALAAELNRRGDRVDVLLNNAGCYSSERKTTDEGLELTFATNHLGPFLLTNLLLERLRASAPARVVNVASVAHRFGRIDVDDLQHARRYRAMEAYCASKLGNVLFTLELARRLEGTGVTANCLHPGVVATRFGQTDEGVFSFLVQLAAPFMIGPERGARTSVYLASSPEVEGVTGKYFVRCRPAKPSALSQDAGLARELWRVSAQLTGLPQP